MKENPGRGFCCWSFGSYKQNCIISPDVNRPEYRAVSFMELADAYYDQIEALVEGGVDILLPETTFDTLNLKTAIYAIEKFLKEKTKTSCNAFSDNYRCIRQNLIRTNY